MSDTAYGEVFLRSVRIVLRFEGDYVDDPRDPGGTTKYGITLGTLTRWRSHLGNKNNITKEDIQNLTEQEACEIYYNWYWIPNKCDRMPPSIALALFDSAVNVGNRRACGLLQQSLGVEDDGIIGSVTLKAISLLSEKRLLVDFLAKRILFYSTLPTFSRFGYGWTRRVLEIEQEALAITKL